MQVSQVTMEREFEALRDIRRRSTAHGGPGTLVLDPDLPASQPKATAPFSPQAWTADNGSPSSARSHGDDEGANGDNGSGADDPIQLFWVPAHLHPELAPSEFRAFLKEHARAPADGSTSLGRSSSAASSLGRKRSMLSRQYKPRENDDAEEEKVVPLRRNKSIFQHEGPQLTISDLQKLEELADRAAKSEDPTQLRRLLRRSMSLNVAPSFLDQMDDVPDATDDADAPIIVPPPNQILRRTARTKIRKPNLSGDGGGHRFPASRATARRKSGGRTKSVDAVTSPTESSSSGHGEMESQVPPIPARKRTIDTEDVSDNRRFTYTEESSIFDAYADTPDDEKAPSPQRITPVTQIPTDTSPQSSISTPPTSISTPSPASTFTSEPATTQQPTPSSQPSVPILHQPQPVKQIIPQQQVIQQPSRTPSPDGSSTAPSSLDIQRPDSRSSATSEAPSHMSTSTAPVDKRKEKDKKSLWKKVGGGSDKQTKKNGKEKDTGFFGSLFGGKKKQEDPPSNMGSSAGPATAAALLGVSKSNKGYSPSVSPQLGNPYARYPIHVERAVYRLSHIKLANPRRPLYEQVLISNLMFWYLGVINKANQPAGQNQNQNQQVQNQQQAGAQSTQGQPQENSQNPGPTSSEKEHLEREQREREERERAERERMEAKEKTDQRREPRKGTLTKPPPSGGGSRRAEMPVKGPQYHIQSQAIEQEYGGSNSTSRSPSAPPASTSSTQNYGGGYSQRAQPMQQQQSYSQSNGNQNYYYGRSGSLDLGSSQPISSGLPPGAMPPVSSAEQLWLATQASTSGPISQTPSASYQYSQGTDYSQNQPPSRSSRSPPSNSYHNSSGSLDWGRTNDSQKTPMRSLSANAVAPSNQQYGNQYYGQGNNQGAGGLKKKMASASAVAPDRRQQVSEDEDVPLAMWQQQRRR